MGVARNLFLLPSSPLVELRKALPQAQIEFDPGMSPAESALLELDEIRDLVGAFDPASLTYPWRHHDPAVDRLQADVMKIVGSMRAAPRRDVFAAIDSLARGEEGSIRPKPDATVIRLTPDATGPAPHLTEAWYCCAEPGPDIGSCI